MDKENEQQQRGQPKQLKQPQSEILENPVNEIPEQAAQGEEQQLTPTNGFNGLNISVRKQGQTFTSLEEKQAAQNLFLLCLAETGVLVHSCKLSHVSFPTYQSWLDDADFADACGAALQEHKEKIYLEADRRGRQGIVELVISNGKLLTDKDGKPIGVRKYSDRLLEALLNRHFPIQATAGTSNIGFTADRNGADAYIHLPWEAMTEEEQAIIEEIGRAIDERTRPHGFN